MLRLKIFFSEENLILLCYHQTLNPKITAQFWSEVQAIRFFPKDGA
jgi:hypothetical protein